MSESPPREAPQARRATRADIPFLAQIEYESTLPPLNQSFWDELVQGTGTSALDFIMAMLETQAGNWGTVEDFWILEVEGQPAAAAAGYLPNPKDYRPLRQSRLGAISQSLSWDEATAALFRDSYQRFWGDNPYPEFLKPQAPWIIETVAVLPQFRGRGLGRAIVQCLLDVGRSQQHSHAGIMVINGNDRARHVYESLGFQPYQTFHAAYYKQQFELAFSGITKFCFDYSHGHIT